jgi:hypothetical protein
MIWKRIDWIFTAFVGTRESGLLILDIPISAVSLIIVERNGKEWHKRN